MCVEVRLYRCRCIINVHTPAVVSVLYRHLIAVMRSELPRNIEGIIFQMPAHDHILDRFLIQTDVGTIINKKCPYYFRSKDHLIFVPEDIGKTLRLHVLIPLFFAVFQARIIAVNRRVDSVVFQFYIRKTLSDCFPYRIFRFIDSDFGAHLLRENFIVTGLVRSYISILHRLEFFRIQNAYPIHSLFQGLLIVLDIEIYPVFFLDPGDKRPKQTMLPIQRILDFVELSKLKVQIRTGNNLI